MKKAIVFLSLMVLICNAAFASKYEINVDDADQPAFIEGITAGGKACRKEEKNVNKVVIQTAESEDECVQRILAEALKVGTYNYARKKAADVAMDAVQPIEITAEKQK